MVNRVLSEAAGPHLIRYCVVDTQNLLEPPSYFLWSVHVCGKRQLCNVLDSHSRNFLHSRHHFPCIESSRVVRIYGSIEGKPFQMNFQ